MLNLLDWQYQTHLENLLLVAIIYYYYKFWYIYIQRERDLLTSNQALLFTGLWDFLSCYTDFHLSVNKEKYKFNTHTKKIKKFSAKSISLSQVKSIINPKDKIIIITTARRRFLRWVRYCQNIIYNIVWKSNKAANAYLTAFSHPIIYLVSFASLETKILKLRTKFSQNQWKSYKVSSSSKIPSFLTLTFRNR